MSTNPNPIQGQPDPALAGFKFNPDTNTVHAPSGEVYSVGPKINLRTGQPEQIDKDDLIPTGTPSSGLADSMRSYWNRASDWINTPILKGNSPLAQGVSQTGQAIVDSEINHAHPYRAALAKFYFGSLGDIDKFASEMTTPTNVGLAALGLSETARGYQSLRALSTAANTYFAFRGAQTMLTARQQGETDADYVQRVLAAGGQVALTGAGAGASGKDFLHDAIQRHLGLSGDLATKVQAKVEAAQGVEAATKGQIASTEQIASGIDKDMQENQIPRRMGNIMADAAQVIHGEKARVEGLFSDLADKATTPVTTSADMRAEIINTLTAHGIQPDEIPGKIFNALPAEAAESTARALTASELKAATAMAQQLSQGLSPSDVRSGLVNLGYAPRQIDAIMSVVSPKAAADDSVSFKDTTRVREDLYNAAQSATDTTLKRALFEAHDNVTGMQQRYAEENGFGKQYQNAKQEYMLFKRGLGDGKMNDFMAAHDVHDQAMLGPTAQLLNPASGEAFRRLFKSMGVDVSPLEDLVNERQSVAEGAKAQTKAIADEAQQYLKQIGEDQSIIPGQSDLQFAGKNTLQIRQDAIRQIVNNARHGGIANPYSLIQIMYGLGLSAAGSLMFGPLHIARGMAPEGIRILLQKPSFQNWIMHEGGVDPTMAPQVKAAMPRWSKYLKPLSEAAQTTVPARAIQQRNDQQITVSQ